ncbi:iron-siderophore ABC transporter substrate-binding protein [Dermatophilus congolensis]|nr:iron-siderophore ABC transporter substrate-binding protein [Dermatophilus congolensis]
MAATSICPNPHSHGETQGTNYPGDYYTMPTKLSSLRRRAFLLAAALCLTGGVVGCSTSDSSTSASSKPASAATEAGAFPATIAHKFGQTVVKEAPTRVVSLGYNDQDALLALGVTPVMVRNWDGMTPSGEAAGAWAKDRIKGEKPQVYTKETVDPEAVAAAKPDLIVATYSDVDKPTYEALSKIAPVIVQKGDYEDYQQPWDVTTEEIGAAVGRPAEAKKLVDGIKVRISELAARHPEWKGKSATVATYDGKALSAFAANDMRTRFFTSLGFEANKEVNDAAKGKFYTELSLEEARKLDSDVLVWDQISYAPKGRSTIESEQSLSSLPAMKDKHALFLEDQLEKAFGWQTVLSLGYVLDHIEKPLDAAVKGE